MSSSWGKILKLTLFGQAHGPAVGLVLDGLPPGQQIDMERLRTFMRRRAPGQAEWASQRMEADEPVFLSGLKDGVTCGAPLAALIENQNAQSGDYRAFAQIPRPGHADFTARARYGAAADLHGGGHLSGRLTAPLCLAGGLALQILTKLDIYIGAHVQSVEAVADTPYDPLDLTKEQLLRAGQRAFPVNDEQAGQQMQKAILAAKHEGDSVGGVIECAALGLPAGIGNPLFEGLENRLAAVLFAIPAVVGLEFGDGFAAAARRGSAHNDPFTVREGLVRTASNHHGGILGGISSGMPLLLRVAIKPTPSIAQEQRSVDLATMRESSLLICGRHDPCVAPRAVPCVEAAVALVLLDILLEQGKI